ncbi:MAG: glutathione S-transferase family protein [Rhodospirillales bacterium]|nr:glutathione S-transferase family protein [Rhodospirillales bacterium]
MLELYYFHGATCGLKARLALAEKGVDYTHKVVDRPYLRTREYKELNPNGVVPTLLHRGTVLIESSIIMDYVDEAFDGPELKPDLPLNRARMAMWLKNADDVYLPSLGTVTYTVSMRHKILEKSEVERKKYLDGIPSMAARERRRLALEMGFESPNFAPALLELDRMLDDMETALGRHEWLADATYSLADAALSPFVERLDELSFAAMWEDSRPAVTDWWDRVKTRESYDQVLGATPNPERPQHTEKGSKAWARINEILTRH